MNRVFVSFAAIGMFFGCSGPDTVSRVDNPAPKTPAAKATAQAPVEDKPMGPNDRCYACHTNFADEKLTRTHLREDMPCAHCHGASLAHAADKDNEDTPPDIVFKRDTIEPLCLDCHKRHRLSQKRVARWQEQQKELGTNYDAPVCTDCHASKHRLQKL